MSETNKGLFAILMACVIWGLSGLYYKALSHVPPIEVLSHRTLWSMIFLGLILLLTGRMSELAKIIAIHNFTRLVVAALMISVNWFFFIWSVHNGQALEASFGYYIFPLVAVLMGYLIFRERLSRLQYIAIAFATLGVMVLGLGLGITPWIAIILATTFGAYGVVKKGLKVTPLTSVLAEVIILSPIALVVLGYFHLNDGSVNGGHFASNINTTLLLIFSGIITAGPLILFSYASQRLSMATVGLIQYLNPTLQFLVASIAFSEPVGQWHVIALLLIWSAIAIYSRASFKRASINMPSKAK